MLLQPLAMAAGESLPFSADFSQGMIPSSIAVANANGELPDSRSYKNGFTTSGWTVSSVGSTGYAAVSPTHTESGASALNTLELPALAIGDGCVLRWKARSVYPLFPDSYRVEITSGGETRTLFTTDAESDEWYTHILSLDGYAGKDAVITFTATSAAGYLLAIDDIYVGVPSGSSFMVADSFPSFVGRESLDASGALPVCGTACNTGAPVSGKIVWKSDGKAIATEPVSDWKTGESLSFAASIPAVMDSRTEWRALLVEDSGNETTLFEGSFYTSAFERFHLLDEATGMWCNNCPEGVVELRELHRRFGDNLITAVTHVTSGSPESDILSNAEYFGALKMYAIPYYRLNRNPEFATGKISSLEPYFDTPVNFSITIDDLSVERHTTLYPVVTVRSAEPLDNSSGRYRIGYVVTADFRYYDGLIFYQNNALSSTKWEEYYFLPSVFMGELAAFDNVTISFENAFTGIEDSLPDALSPEGATYTWGIPLSDYVESWNDCRLIVYVLDTETGRVENAYSRKVTDGTSVGVDRLESTASGIILTADASGLCHARVEDGCRSVRFTQYSATGLAEGSAEVSVAGGEAIYRPVPRTGSISIVRAECCCGSASMKIK